MNTLLYDKISEMASIMYELKSTGKLAYLQAGYEHVDYMDDVFKVVKAHKEVSLE